MVDRTRLESGLTFTGNGSSNLPLSASLLKMSFGACPQLDPFSNSRRVLSGGNPENLFVYSPIAMLPVAEAICKTGFAGGDPFVNPPGQWGPMLVISKYGRTTSTGRKSSRSSRKSTFVRGVAQPLQSVILVADDEALFLNSVTMMLQRQGYVVLSASDGVEALESVTPTRRFNRSGRDRRGDAPYERYRPCCTLNGGATWNQGAPDIRHEYAPGCQPGLGPGIFAKALRWTDPHGEGSGRCWPLQSSPSDGTADGFVDVGISVATPFVRN